VPPVEFVGTPVVEPFAMPDGVVATVPEDWLSGASPPRTKKGQASRRLRIAAPLSGTRKVRFVACPGERASAAARRWTAPPDGANFVASTRPSGALLLEPSNRSYSRPKNT
jgi:hypothetical protein